MPTKTSLRSVEPADTLLVRAGTGDQVAFAGLYSLTCDWVFGIVASCLPDVSESESVTLEVYLEIWRSAARYEISAGPAISWIVDVAIRESMDRNPLARVALDTPA